MDYIQQENFKVWTYLKTSYTDFHNIDFIVMTCILWCNTLQKHLGSMIVSP